MNKTEMKNLCDNIIDHYLEMMNTHIKYGRRKEAESLHREIREWIIQKDDLQVFFLNHIEPFMR
jgi:hypothetical protein